MKGIVKLQALIRGQNVRKQAKMTLKCMQALLRVQARVREQRARLSHDGGRRSMFAETTNLWDSKYHQDIRDRQSRSRDGSSIADDWRDCPRSLLELESMLQARKEASFKREKSLAHAFTQQVLDEMDAGSEERNERELEETANWLDQWMSSKQWNTSSRGSLDRRDSIKTVEMDTAYKPYSNMVPHARRSQHSSPLHRQASSPRYTANSPHRQRPSHYNYSAIQPPATPPPSQPKPLQMRPTSPRKSQSTANTPCLRSTSRSNSLMSRYSTSGNDASVPNYMAATESAKARIRSQSTPKQRPSTPERERVGSVKKRLSYPIPEPYSQNLRSPSFKSLQAAYVGMEQQSNYSCYTDSLGGEISPCSTTDLRRWLR